MFTNRHKVPIGNIVSGNSIKCPINFAIIITAPTNAKFRYVNTASQFLNNKNFFKKQEHFRSTYSHYYIEGENVLHSHFGIGCFFLCPENKTQVEKAGKETFDASGMKLYYPKN